MAFYCMYIMDRQSRCVFFRDFRTKNQSLQITDSAENQTTEPAESDPSDSSEKPKSIASPREIKRGIMKIDLAEESKLVLGAVLSLETLMNRVSPKYHPDNFGFDLMDTFETDTYKLHLYHTLSGLRFIILTDPQIEYLGKSLEKLYSEIYVKYAVMNAFISPHNCFEDPSFVKKVVEFVEKIRGRG